MSRIIKDIAENIEEKELIMILVLTSFFILLAFVSHSRVTTVMISSRYGDMDIHIVYYGFPFEMIGYLNPIGALEWAALNALGESYLRVLWDGVSLNIILFFCLSFVIIYAFKKITFKFGAQKSFNS